MKFKIATNLDYYGSEAKESDIADYAEFAEDYLLSHGYSEFEVEFVSNYPYNDDQYELRQEVWTAFCHS